ncbi:MAG: hypothetical protein ACHQHN_00245 [Sphingobacteriales bacterium]
MQKFRQTLLNGDDVRNLSIEFPTFRKTSVLVSALSFADIVALPAFGAKVFSDRQEI